jgi:uncharacterized protein
VLARAGPVDPLVTLVTLTVGVRAGRHAAVAVERQVHHGDGRMTGHDDAGSSRLGRPQIGGVDDETDTQGLEPGLLAHPADGPCVLVEVGGPLVGVHGDGVEASEARAGHHLDVDADRGVDRDGNGHKVTGAREREVHSGVVHEPGRPVLLPAAGARAVDEELAGAAADHLGEDVAGEEVEDGIRPRGGGVAEGGEAAALHRVEGVEGAETVAAPALLTGPCEPHRGASHGRARWWVGGARGHRSTMAHLRSRARGDTTGPDGQSVRVLRQRLPVRPLTTADHDAALECCSRDRAANVFVAARIVEGSLRTSPGSVLGHWNGSELAGLTWVSANVVPVELDDDGVTGVAQKISRMRRQVASIFGPSTQVSGLWERLGPGWGPVRAVRRHQPLLSTSLRPSVLGMELDPGVRPATPAEVDLVVPAAAHMFTEEIGYPPFYGSDRGYRASIASLIRAGHTYVKVEDGEVVFKADVGSLALGCAQVQGVWLHPRLRGQGLSVPAMASVVDQVLASAADEVSLYVNDYNVAARATYARCGFREVGAFTTVLL